jgi:hypothetical protein
VFQFKFTDYYYQEMGENILRVYFSFHRMIKRDELADVKLASNIFETKFADSQGRRKVNIDPGIVLPGNLTLATTKDSAHRIYIGKGIYAEITLIYEKGEYRSLPWTYPDYALKEIRHFFSEVRKQMLRQRKETMITG